VTITNEYDAFIFDYYKVIVDNDPLLV